MKTSPLFSLNVNDLVKGLIMAVLTPVIYLIEQTIEKGSFTFDWHAIGIAAATGFVGYLMKNFFTPQQPTQTITKTPDGTVTENVIKTDTVDVKVDAIKP